MKKAGGFPPAVVLAVRRQEIAPIPDKIETLLKSRKQRSRRKVC
jgi:hypothetical protein